MLARLQRRTATRRRSTIAPMPNIASILKSEIARVARKEVRGETLGLKKAVERVPRRDCRAQAAYSGAGTGTAPPEQGQREGCAGRSERGVLAEAPFQREGPGVTAAAAWAVGRGLRAPAGRVRAVHLQLGAGQGPSSGQAPAGHRCPQDHGQEGSDCAAGVSASGALAALVLSPPFTEGHRHAARDDRPRPDGREHGAPPACETVTPAWFSTVSAAAVAELVGRRRDRLVLARRFRRQARQRRAPSG